MKLSNLYTEDLILENDKKSKGLLGRFSKIFSRARQTPNPRHARIKAIIKDVYENEIWEDYFEDPKAFARVEDYQNSMEQHIPELSKIGDEQALRDEVEKMFRKRAGYVIKKSRPGI